MTKQSVKLMVVSWLMLFSLTACVNQDVEPQLNASSRIQWPAAPQAAKVKYIRSVKTAEDLGIKKSFWQRVSEFIVGAEEQQLVRPMAMISQGQTLYVADPGIAGIHVFDRDNNQYRLLQQAGDTKLLSPVAITQDVGGKIYFSDSALKKIFTINTNKDIEKLVIKPIDLDYSFDQPTGIAYNAVTAELLVIDTRQHQLLRFNLAGDYLGAVGQRGTSIGQFNFPTMLSVDPRGTILVTDSLNFRVQQFDRSGRYLSQYSRLGNASGYQARPKGVASDKTGNIYIVDSLFHNIQVYNRNGDFLLSIGEQGQLQGQFWLPTGIYIDEQERMYVADSHNHRLQILQVIR